jgi:hypothetical protein
MSAIPTEPAAKKKRVNEKGDAKKIAAVAVAGDASSSSSTTPPGPAVSAAPAKAAMDEAELRTWRKNAAERMSQKRARDKQNAEDLVSTLTDIENGSPAFLRKEVFDKCRYLQKLTVHTKQYKSYCESKCDTFPLQGVTKQQRDQALYRLAIAATENKTRTTLASLNARIAARFPTADFSNPDSWNLEFCDAWIEIEKAHQIWYREYRGIMDSNCFSDVEIFREHKRFMEELKSRNMDHAAYMGCVHRALKACPYRPIQVLGDVYRFN